MNQLPKPKKYTDLISEIEKGKIKIPKFQRNFIWSIEKTAKFLDSILKGYPIGTFVLWETNKRLNGTRNIGNLELPPTPDDINVQYILDGQQRITSLYAGYLGASIQRKGEKKITNYGSIFIDLELNIDNNDEQIIVAKQPKHTFITLNEVLNLKDNLLVIKEQYSNEQFKRIHQYSKILSTYRFLTVVIDKEDIDSAIEVFTRINTGGQTLTLLEIVDADLNKQKERTKAPSIYIQDFMDENDGLAKSIKPHSIDNIDDFGVFSNDYSLFLEKRSTVINKALKNRVDLKNNNETENSELKKQILIGENEKLEIKSTLRFDLKQNVVNKNLEFLIAKTVSAFLNSDGGTLIIGVGNDGNILGLEKDIATLSKKDINGFELYLRNIIKTYLGSDFKKSLKVTFPTIDEKTICKIQILKSGKPVFANFEGKDNFYVRNGSSSISKNGEEQKRYEKLHWK